jgi:hypothetical protein
MTMIEAIPQLPNLPNFSYSERDFLIQALEFVFCDRAEALAAIADMDEEEAYGHVYNYQDMILDYDMEVAR